jgi:ABC-type transport system involved in cytochrome c biogenesis permease subunit
MMTVASTVHLGANLILFGLFLLYLARLYRPDWVANRMLVVASALFLSVQGAGLFWAGVQLGPWAFASPYLGTMFVVEAGLIVYLVQERLSRQPSLGPFVIGLAFAIHALAIFFIPFPAGVSLQASPLVRSPWYLLHLLTALVGYGACLCAAGGSVAYFFSRHATRSRFVLQLAPSQDCQVFSRSALLLGYPWLSGSVVAGMFWAQLAWGRYWIWPPGEAWVLAVWLVLTATLHARTLPTWKGAPLAILSLLALALAVFSVPLLGQVMQAAR